MAQVIYTYYKLIIRHLIWHQEHDKCWESLPKVHQECCCQYCITQAETPNTYQYLNRYKLNIRDKWRSTCESQVTLMQSLTMSKTTIERLRSQYYRNPYSSTGSSFTFPSSSWLCKSSQDDDPWLIVREISSNILGNIVYADTLHAIEYENNFFVQRPKYMEF
jgi:hypothetical protein